MALSGLQTDILAENLGNELNKAVKAAEQQVEAELSALDRVHFGDEADEELEKLRAKRLEDLKRTRDQVEEWKARGHGSLVELPLGLEGRGEKPFFEECKANHHIVCHFFKDSNMHCKIIDKHLATIAPRHLEAKFIKINAEKAPFLVDRLKLTDFPTVLLIEGGQVIRRLFGRSGFHAFQDREDFPADALEYLLVSSPAFGQGVIRYALAGSAAEPPESVRRWLGLGTDGTSSSIFGFGEAKGKGKGKGKGAAGASGKAIREGFDNQEEDW